MRYLLFPLLLAAAATAKDSIHANPSNAQIGLTSHGSDWLWAVFAVMVISDLVFLRMLFRLPRGERVFHYLPVIILTTASIAYFSMASNLGQAAIRTQFRGNGATRSIFYVRYIDWVITTPLLLIELLLATGLSLSDIVTVVFFDLAMIIVGLVGALVASSYKWGYFTLGVFFEFYVWYVLLGPARSTAGLLSTDHRSAYTRSAIFLSVIWALYPVCWGLAEGGNVISVTGEMIFYGILDIIAKPVFCFMHVSALRRIPYSSFGLTSGKFTGLEGGTMRHAGGGITGHDQNGLMGERSVGGTSNGTTTTAGAAPVGHKHTGINGAGAMGPGVGTAPGVHDARGPAPGVTV